MHQRLTGVSNVAELVLANPTQSFSQDGETAWLSASQNRQNVSDLPYLNVIVQSATKTLTAEEFRAFAFKNLTKGAHGEKHLEYNHIPIARYRTELGATGSYPGPAPDTVALTMAARNLEAYLVKDDIWVRIRFTARSIRSSGAQLFQAVVDSARFVDVSNPVTSFDYYSVGMTLTAKRAYSRAVENFGVALKLEKERPQLDIEQWRDLVRRTAEAHAALSDLSAAAEVLEYGVTRDPANTDLRMQLARVYASLRDSEKTLAVLSTALPMMRREKEIFERTKFRGATSPIMLLPDLNKDAAFKEMMKDKSFRDAVKALKK